jgi:hypothetical protein
LRAQVINLGSIPVVLFVQADKMYELWRQDYFLLNFKGCLRALCPRM